MAAQAIGPFFGVIKKTNGYADIIVINQDDT